MVLTIRLHLPKSLVSCLLYSAMIISLWVLLPVSNSALVSAADRDGDLVSDETDIDDDNDGLIEIHDLEGLNEIRYQQDGRGKKQSASAELITLGCPTWGCLGYELTRELNFNSNSSYRDVRNKANWTVDDYGDAADKGWQPIPYFQAVFNGNGFAIRNLGINRDREQDIGLFATIGADGRVENLELLYPDIEGKSNVGGVVGVNNGVIVNTYVRDYHTVGNDGTPARNQTRNIEAIRGTVGGMVGRNNGGGPSLGYIINSGASINVFIRPPSAATPQPASAGGLVGFNLNGAEIRNSYARGNVSSPCGAGGLTGNNFSTNNTRPETNSKIINSYATGRMKIADGSCNIDFNIRSGGLVAINSGLIEHSYATGCWDAGTVAVAGNRRSGLVAINDGTVTDSYWENKNTCSGLSDIPAGSGKPTADLQTPTAATDIYENWDVNDWDFGGNMQHPAIRYAAGSDRDNPSCGVGTLPPCSDLIKHQLPTDREVTSLLGPIAKIVLSYAFSDGLKYQPTAANVVDNVFPEVSTSPEYPDVPAGLLFPTSIHASWFSDRRNWATIMLTTTDTTVPGGARTRTYQFNVIPVTSIPGEPQLPTQPSEYNDKGMIKSLTVTASIDGVSKTTKVVPSFDTNKFNYDIYFESETATGAPQPTSLFTDNFRGSQVIRTFIKHQGIKSYSLRPPSFSVNKNRYELYLEEDGSSTIRYEIRSHNDYIESNCRADFSWVKLRCDAVLHPVFFRVTGSEIEASFSNYIPHTMSFSLSRYSVKRGDYSIDVIPIPSTDTLTSVMVTSEVNGQDGDIFVFPGDEIVIKDSDTVLLDASDSFALREGAKQPLEYRWDHISGRRLFFGVRRVAAIPLQLSNTLLAADVASGITRVALGVRERYNPNAGMQHREIAVRVLKTDRMSLTSRPAPIMQDRGDATLYRVVLASHQTSAVITAISKLEGATLTVDDSNAAVTAVNSGGNFASSTITVEVDEGAMEAFTIRVTAQDGTAIVYTVRVFRRSAVELTDITLSGITIGRNIIGPGTYTGILKSTITTQLAITAAKDNTLIRSVTVDDDGDGNNATQLLSSALMSHSYAMGESYTKSSLSLSPGAVIKITVRVPDAYVEETRATPTLSDIDYAEGIYTINIRDKQPPRIRTKVFLEGPLR